MQKLIILSFLMLFLAACSQKVWEQTPNGVLIHPKSETENGAKTINLQVISEQIIRVVASPSDQLSEIKSLCVVDQTNATPTFEVTEQNDSLILSTSKVKAKVSLTSGAVVFYDENNRIILQERAKGGKSFSPITVEGTKGYSFSQIFESPDDEAFYGLGQHQSDEFNYKGRNEILYQYNTKVAVPFVVSNKNYGLLWDNYSVTKFGDPRDYSDMDLFTLYDSNGEEGGLSATYYTNSDTSQIFVNRKESAIDYENLTTIKKFLKVFSSTTPVLCGRDRLNPKKAANFILNCITPDIPKCTSTTCWLFLNAGVLPGIRIPINSLRIWSRGKNIPSG